MIVFTPIAQAPDGPDTHAYDLRALVALGQGAALRVFGLTGAEGGIALWRPVQGLALVEALYLPPVAGVSGGYGLALGDKGGAPTLLAYGAREAGLGAVALDGLGDPDDLPVRLGPVGVTFGAFAHGQGLIWGAAPGSGVVQSWGFDGVALGAEVAAVTLWDTTLPGHGVTGLSALSQGRVLAAGQGAGAPPELALLAGDHVQYLGGDQGLYLSGPVTLSDSFAFDGATWVVAAAAGSGSLALVEVTETGLQLRDQVNDTRDTRFQGVTEIAVTTLGERAFVLAAGVDDGVSLLTLLPGGRLVHLGTQADTAALRLGNPSALAMVAGGEALEVFTAGDEAPGIGWMRIELGALAPMQRAGEGGAVLVGDGRGDLLLGGIGSDDLRGGAGADILVDGAGSDRLSGGSGADLFVLNRDGLRDVIVDFEPGLDRLDLSAWGRIYGVDSVDVLPVAQGALLRTGDEVLELQRAGGGAIRAGDLRDADLAGLWHVGPDWSLPDAAPAPRDRMGGAGDDLILGGAGDDLLQGGAGRDTLLARDGDDLIFGEGFEPAGSAVSDIVFRLYISATGREPGQAAYLDWAERITLGTEDLGQLARDLAGDLGGSDITFVAQVFANATGRAPGAVAPAYEAALAAGLQNRAEVLLEIAQSAEAEAHWQSAARARAESASAAPWVDDLFRLYQATLGRAPDAEGVLFWADMLGAGLPYGQVVSGFVTSPEFAARFGAPDGPGFVALLYQNVLGRAPDAAGRLFWESALEAGVGRAALVEGFAQSAEFRSISAEAAADWLRASLPGDEIRPGTGRDTVFGGIGADRLVLFPGDGSVVFGDAEPWDEVAVQGFDADFELQQDGSDVVWRDAGIDLRLVGVDLAQAGEMFV